MATLAFLFAAGLAELGVRLALPAWRPPPVDGVPFFRPDPRLGWALREGWRGPFELPHRTIQVDISEQGFRDEVHPPHAPPGRKRILLLGDSFAWGFGVEKSETFESLLEKRVPGLEVVNAAVPAYGTDQELLLLEERGLALHPDLVLVLFHPNDLLNNTWPRQYGYPKPVFRAEGNGLRLENVPVPGGAAYELGMRTLRRSYVLHRLWALLKEPPQDLHRSSQLAWDVTERLLARLSEGSTQAGARFVVVTFPWGHGPTDLLLDRVSERIAARGLSHLDLGASVPPSLIERTTEHWSPEGHRAAAEALAPPLAALLDLPPPPL